MTHNYCKEFSRILVVYDKEVIRELKKDIIYRFNNIAGKIDGEQLTLKTQFHADSQ